MKLTKKLFGVLSIASLMAFSLASCGSKGDDLSVDRKPALSDATKELYNLNFDSSEANSTKIQENDTYAIYASKDIKASLITYEVDVLSLKVDDKPLIETEADKLRELKANTLVFSEGLEALYETEKTQYINLLYNATEGINKAASSEYLGFTPDYSAVWTKTSNLKSAYEFYKNNSLTELKCDIVYLPTYFVRKDNGREIMTQYILAPIYMTYTYENGAKEIVDGASKESAISTISKKEFSFKKGSNQILNK